MERICVGKFYNDFTGYEISKSGKSIEVWDALSPNSETFKIKDAGTEFARFESKGWSCIVQYYLKDFVTQEAKK